MRHELADEANDRIRTYVRDLWDNADPLRIPVPGTSVVVQTFSPVIEAPVIMNDVNSDGRIRFEVAGTVSSNAWPLDEGDTVTVPLRDVGTISFKGDLVGGAVGTGTIFVMRFT